MATMMERFEAKCLAVPSGCVEWQGAKSRHSQHVERGGYGQFRAGARIVYTHRFIWEQTHGEIPTGYEVDHMCHNRACCNPDHLQLLLKAENIREANARRYATASV